MELVKWIAGISLVPSNRKYEVQFTSTYVGQKRKTCTALSLVVEKLVLVGVFNVTQKDIQSLKFRILAQIVDDLFDQLHCIGLTYVRAVREMNIFQAFKAFKKLADRV